MNFFGNGKRHRTPTPVRLKRIKRISFKAFLYLKELFKNFRREEAKPKKDSKFLSPRAPRINDPTTKIYPALSKKDNIAIHNYEPSRIHNTRNSLFWQWRRVAEWDKYINDPYENINGHIIT